MGYLAVEEWKVWRINEGRGQGEIFTHVCKAIHEELWLITAFCFIKVVSIRHAIS